MTFLSDRKILEMLSNGDLIIHPLMDVRQISGSKIDLRLDNVFYTVLHIKRSHYDPMVLREGGVPGDYRYKHVVKYGESFVLHPNEFILAPLFEFIKLPSNLAGRLDGRSSLGRLGVLVHSTAGAVDPGYVGPLVMELSNIGKLPVALYPLLRVATLTLIPVEGEVIEAYDSSQRKYGGKVQDIEGSPSLLYADNDLSVIEKMKERA